MQSPNLPKISSLDDVRDLFKGGHLKSQYSIAGALTSALDFVTGVNVQGFEATGNGTTDNNTAITNAITALNGSGDLYFPKGTYRIASNLTVAAGIRLIFEQGAMISADGVAISAITKANPGEVTTSSTHNFSNGDKVRFKDVGGMVELNYSTNSGVEYTVTVVNSTKFTIGVDTSAYTTYTSGGYAQHILTINGTIDAGLYQIFTGNGSVTLNKVKEVYPQWLGAVADGVTDDTMGIQRSLDAIIDGGVVSIPEGTYIISASLRMNSKTTLRGGGYNSCIKLKDGLLSNSVNTTLSMLDNNNQSVGNTGLSIEHLKFDGNKNNQIETLNPLLGLQSFAIDWRKVTYSYIHDVWIENAAFDGIYLDEVDSSDFKNIIIDNPGRQGIALLRGLYNNFIGGVVNSPALGGVRLEQMNATANIQYNIVDGFYVYNAGSLAIAIVGQGTNAITTICRNTITNCHVNTSGQAYNSNAGIHIANASYNIITNNYVNKAWNHGIACAGSGTINQTHNIINSNIIENCSQVSATSADGINLSGGLYTVCLGNTIIGGTQHRYAILLRDEPLSGNEIKYATVGANTITPGNSGGISISHGIATHTILPNAGDATSFFYNRNGIQIGSSQVSSVGTLMERYSSGVQATTHEYITPQNTPLYSKIWGGKFTGEFAGSVGEGDAFIIANSAGSGIMRHGHVSANPFVYGNITWVFDITKTGISVMGDIAATGGFKQPFNFMQNNVVANQSAVALDVLGLLGNTEVTMPYAGSLLGISIASNAARTNGTLTVDATINGTVVGLQAVLNEANPQYHSATQAKDTDVFTASQRIGVNITTDGTWAPTTADIVVCVIVEM